MAEKPDRAGRAEIVSNAMRLAEEAVIPPSVGGERGRPCARIPPGVSERGDSQRGTRDSANHGPATPILQRLAAVEWREFAISPSARREQAGPERPCFERSALAGVRGCRVDATLCHATLYRATLCQRRRGRQFNHGVYA